MGGLIIGRYSCAAREPIYGTSKQDGASRTTPELRSPLKGGFIMNIARSFNNWRQYRRTVAELSRMTPRDLSDLGISQCDIHRVARQAAGL
jgi:uncharacterized protein YjiS (DUF1127 family)